jgi:putative ABC transport system permease protein
MKINPPKRALNFLRWFCREDYLEEIEGDLTEVFKKQYEDSPRKAKWKFAWSVVKYFRPEFIKSFRNSYQPDSYGMFKSYFKVGWRNLVRNQGYSFINIGGLAMGMAIAMLIGLWIYDELSFNKYYKNYDAIGQIWGGGTNPETSVIEGTIALQHPAGAALRNNYQHYFKHVLMAWWLTDYTVSLNDNKFTMHGEFIDGGVLDMFSLKMLKGTHASLKDQHSIVLSKSASEAIFGKEDPIGKALKIDNRMDVQVTGIYEDIPKNNHFNGVSFFSTWSLWVTSNDWIKAAENNWDNRSFNIYVQLQPHTTMEDANEAIKDFYNNNLPKDFLSTVAKYKPFIQVVPMNTWHLYSEFENGKPATGRIVFIWLFGIAGVFVLLLACINFINLSTARSEKRARETGIRKAIGSLKAQLIGQFLSESFLVVIFAFALSAVLVWLSFSWFNEISDKNIVVPLYNPVFWTVAIVFLLVTGFMAGLYPAFYLSSFQPAKVLKGAIRSGRWASLPRKVLVVVQFSVSVVLVIGTVIVYQQIQHAMNRQIGYNRESLISFIMIDPNFRGKHDVVRNELVNTGFVEEIAFSNSPLTHPWNNSGGFDWKGKDPNKDSDFTVCNVSDTYGKTIKWKLLQGRDIDKNRASDTAAVIINASAAKYMNLQNPVGETISHESGFKATIIGVVEDLIMGSPYEPVKPSLFFWNKYEQTNIIIRLIPNAIMSDAIPAVEKVFKTIVPTAAFAYKFADDEYAKKFSQEQRIGQLSGVFAVLAIFISALGLFGLASYVAEQRTKEIGIRKVLGASVSNLWRLLSRDFVVLVIISCIIAIPVAYYFMESWLQKYQYRTEISWWIFLMTGIGALTITLLTVSFQAVRAALMNPVKSLKSE